MTLGGDPVYFNATSLAKYHAAFYVDTTLGSFKAQPVPSLLVFKAGDVVYLYYTGTGFVLSTTLTGAPVVDLPSGRVAVRLVDTYSGTLISQETVVQGPVATLPAGNVTPTATPALTATPTPTPTPTPTATPSLGTLVANFDWIEKGKGGDVHFTDTSTGSPSSWSWDFGDGATSTSQNPVHNFGKGASSSVTLTTSRSSDGATGSITKTITTV